MGDILSILTRGIIHKVLYLIVPLTIVGIRIVWRFSKQVNSEDWPAIQGKCTFAGVTKKKGVYELKVLYSYKLATEKFPTCGEFYKDLFHENQANQWAQALQEMNIPIHCHPSNPEKSILWVEDLESIVKARQAAAQGGGVPPTAIPAR